jgi:hypothetical protein
VDGLDELFFAEQQRRFVCCFAIVKKYWRSWSGLGAIGGDSVFVEIVFFIERFAAATATATSILF